MTLDATAFAKEIAERMRTRKRRGKLLFISAPLVRVRNEKTGLMEWRVQRPGKTWRNTLRAPGRDVSLLPSRDQRLYQYRQYKYLSPRQARRICKAARRELKWYDA